MRWLALAVALCWGPVAQALDTHDELTLSLDGGESLTGWYVRSEADVVVLAVPGLPDTTRVPLNLVSAATCNGEEITLHFLREEVEAAYQGALATLADPPPHPLPVLVAGGSLLVPGAGQALLGQRREALGYLIADLVLLGAGALELHGEQRLGVLVPIVGVDLILRASSAGDAVRSTIRRRQRLREMRTNLAAPTQR